LIFTAVGAGPWRVKVFVTTSCTVTTSTLVGAGALLLCLLETSLEGLTAVDKVVGLAAAAGVEAVRNGEMMREPLGASLAGLGFAEGEAAAAGGIEAADGTTVVVLAA
jgi:hypothetical protein